MLIRMVDMIGKHCSSRVGENGHIGGIDIRNIIENNWDNETEITISFENVESATPSFLDEAFGKLVLNHNFSELKSKLKFDVEDPTIKNRINENIVLRLRQLAK